MNRPKFIQRRKGKKVIIMDGTDLKLVKSIVETIQRAGSFNGKKPKVVIDHNAYPNSSMTVVTFTLANLKDHSYIRKMLNREYPGLCVFENDCKEYGISI